jgi:benzoate/toluate 1,2-dioxygenase reductase subunit
MPESAIASFIVRNIPGGKMSEFLTDSAAPGQAITIEGPYGSFYLRDPVRPMLFLAGGTGIAPFMSMLDSLIASGNTQPVYLVFGITHDYDLVEMEKLAAIKENHPWFDYRICATSEDSVQPLKGYVTAHMESAWLEDEIDVYLCGPVPMVDAVRQWLESVQVVPKHFYFEKFSAKES